MSHLLDVNLLLALFDEQHGGHEAAHRWFAEARRHGWATCSVTETGFIRVVSSPAFPTVSVSPREAANRLAQFCDSGGHVFWADDAPPRVALRKVFAHLQGHRQVTDFHLAALACRRGGRMATFDTRLARALKGTALEAAVTLIR